MNKEEYQDTADNINQDPAERARLAKHLLSRHMDKISKLDGLSDRLEQWDNINADAYTISMLYAVGITL